MSTAELLQAILDRLTEIRDHLTGKPWVVECGGPEIPSNRAVDLPDIPRLPTTLDEWKAAKEGRWIGMLRGTGVGTWKAQAVQLGEIIHETGNCRGPSEALESLLRDMRTIGHIAKV